MSPDRNEIDLPKHLEKILNKQDRYKPEKLEKKIFKKNPVPGLIREVPELDPYMEATLLSASEMNRDPSLKFEITRDKQLAHCENQIRNILCPLSTLLKKTEEKELYLEDIVELVDQTIILVNQSRLGINFQRQRGILSAILRSDTQAKAMIKENQEMLNKANKSENRLFGRELKRKLKKEGDASDLANILVKKPRYNSQERAPIQNRPFRSVQESSAQGPSWRNSYDEQMPYHPRGGYTSRGNRK